MSRLPRRQGVLAAVAAGVLAATGRAASGQVPAEGLAGLARATGCTFGTAVDSLRLAADAGYAGQVTAEAQLLVPEWEAKWAALQPQPGVFDFGPLSAVAGFAQAHGRQLRGHTLVWHTGMPPWLLDGIAEGPARARALLTAHLDAVLPATRPAIRDWDVVNEAIANPEGNPFTARTPAVGDLRDTPWLRALGPGYVELAFRLARERDRSLRLTYNDYGLEGGTPWAEEKRQRVLRLLRRLLEAQVPVDALGLQAHLLMDEPFRPELLAGFLRTVREMGLAVLVTELDVREGRQLPAGLAGRDALVAERVKAVVGTALEQGCRTVLTWGLSDKDSWLTRDPDVMRKDGESHRGLPLDAEGNRKPMWQALAQCFAARRP
ncbi:endo-1,4-beta-xylanase [Paeniroseomonas aquatica]|uniref:Beta-xylanase n=1 Tax=Paeniroseomonas aquatica TaxID=373043 RepID=A0ABT8A868_9PROT|nr:endo-1,4-beta-xylanase [Paeniroseomonas aquatica]MDN3566002.1 endo-1,4-beta-xylanase [Paeniroseomonas aquatica]